MLSIRYQLVKAPGTDGIPSDVVKCGGKELLRHLSDLFSQILSEESVPQDIKDALIMHIYKLGDRAVCDNHRDISVLSVTGQVLACILLNKLVATCCRFSFDKWSYDKVSKFTNSIWRAAAILKIVYGYI